MLLGTDLVLVCSYVGGAPGKIDLYVGKEVVRRAIPMDDATNQLIELIKEHDRFGHTQSYRLETCTKLCLTYGSHIKHGCKQHAAIATHSMSEIDVCHRWMDPDEGEEDIEAIAEERLEKGPQPAAV